MSDGLSFTPVRIEDLSDGEFTARLEKELAEAAVLIGDARTYGDKARARITVTFDVIASADKRMPGGVVIQTGWNVRTPKALPEALSAWMRGGRLVTQKAEQLDMEDLQRRMQEERGLSADPEPARPPPIGGSPRRREPTITPRGARGPVSVQEPDTDEDEENIDE